MPAPLLFLDVDGTLLPFRDRGRAGAGSANPLPARLDPADGARLLALGCELVWATTWNDAANEELAPRLGLPELPVVAWPDVPVRGLHWKTTALMRWAGGRPFAWLDDEISDVDQWWVAGQYPAPALLRRVDAGSGLGKTDYAAVRDWVPLLR
ncbi:HAD domain-containing protein [Actinoplanes sp. TRM 88003]|uniref:HAD domain-containing protein n=1 Tax=Paractinoplanes aksuensis TaxID=2939490 RepID=A0ABT1DG40_9ACTN|nr:HAD domain-containing protein [Actinoplanes aksuensis]MCO8269775.1 HAD domain-containing protein [Actinoplanes aksuensis]